MYQNHNENVKRYTTRGTREIVVVHPVDELGVIGELNQLVSDMNWIWLVKIYYFVECLLRIIIS